MAVLAREVATEVTLADSESLLVPVRDGPPALGWLNEEDMEVFMTPDVRRMWLAGERETLCMGAKRP